MPNPGLCPAIYAKQPDLKGCGVLASSHYLSTVTNKPNKSRANIMLDTKQIYYLDSIQCKSLS